MALNRSSVNRFSATIWPGFVDAMTALLMVMMFVVTIFVIVQWVLREQISDQGGQIAAQGELLTRQKQRLEALGQRVTALSEALTTSETERDRVQQLLDDQTSAREKLEKDFATAEAQARDRAAHVVRLSNQLESSRNELDDANSRLTDFEAEVAALISARNTEAEEAEAAQQDLTAQLQEQQERASAAELAVAAAREELDTQTEQARLAAARREALEALVEQLRSESGVTDDSVTRLQDQLVETQQQLSKAEADRLAEAEAAGLLRERLKEADAELTAMTLSLEESRKQAQETLTLLAAAEAARDELQAEQTTPERQAALLATALERLAVQKELTAEDQRRLALLNEQVASLTARLETVQQLLDNAGEAQEMAELRVDDLGQQLNAALLRAAEERGRRLALEEEARLRAEAELLDLRKYRSDFFARMSQLLAGREGITVEGDRFGLQSEVLFPSGQARLTDSGRHEIENLTRMLQGVSDEIPSEIDWIIRVDGHTDNVPLSGDGKFRDNWELSQARALSVVNYMIDELGFPADRLAAAGFANTHPVASNATARGRAMNRRIELKLTER